MVTMRCIIVDDQPLIRELLEDNVRHVPFLDLVKSCSNAPEALEILRKKQIDIIFLSIPMPRPDGMRLLTSLPDGPLVIIVTAHEEYSVDAFNLPVIDYLLKPFNFERFLKACNRAAELFRLKKAKATSGNSKST